MSHDRAGSNKDLKSSILNTAGDLWHSKSTQRVTESIKKKVSQYPLCGRPDLASAGTTTAQTGVDLNPVGKYLPPKRPGSTSNPSQPGPSQAPQSQQPQQPQQPPYVPVGYSQPIPHFLQTPHHHVPYGQDANYGQVSTATLSPQPTGAALANTLETAAPVQSSVNAASGQPASATQPVSTINVPYVPRPSKWTQKVHAQQAYAGGTVPMVYQNTGGSQTGSFAGAIQGQNTLPQQFAQVSLNSGPLPPPPQHPSRPPISPSPTHTPIPTGGPVHNIYAPVLPGHQQQQGTMVPPPLPANRPSPSPSPGPMQHPSTQQSPSLATQSPPLQHQVAPVPIQSPTFQHQASPLQQQPQLLQPQSPPVQHPSSSPAQHQVQSYFTTQPVVPGQPPVSPISQPAWQQPAASQSPSWNAQFANQQQVQQPDGPYQAGSGVVSAQQPSPALQHAQVPQPQQPVQSTASYPQPVLAHIQTPSAQDPVSSTLNQSNNEIDMDPALPVDAPPPYELLDAVGSASPSPLIAPPPTQNPSPVPSGPSALATVPAPQQLAHHQYPNEKWTYRHESEANAGCSSSAGPSTGPSAGPLPSTSTGPSAGPSAASLTATQVAPAPSSSQFNAIPQVAAQPQPLPSPPQPPLQQAPQSPIPQQMSSPPIPHQMAQQHIPQQMTLQMPLPHLSQQPSQVPAPHVPSPHMPQQVSPQQMPSPYLAQQTPPPQPQAWTGQLQAPQNQQDADYEAHVARIYALEAAQAAANTQQYQQHQH